MASEEGSDSFGKINKLEDQGSNDDVQITCFTEDLNDVTFHFQIIKLTKQVINIPNILKLEWSCHILLFSNFFFLTLILNCFVIICYVCLACFNVLTMFLLKMSL